jgi:hypothetical protein
MVTGRLLYKEELGMKIKAGRPRFVHLHYNTVNKQHSAITIRNTFRFIKFFARILLLLPLRFNYTFLRVFQHVKVVLTLSS